ncbi:hypothetical protein TSMEX_003408 [Taenia solium]|eukprot:TsM_001179400 transcript=TsM_001179400 gene=TsM_001179400
MHRRRKEETNSSNGQASSCVTSQGTANVAQELVEATPRERVTSANEGENGKEEGGLNVGTDVNLHEGVSRGEDWDSRGQIDHSVAELFPKPKTRKKNKQGKHKSSNRSEGHPSQYHAQPAIDPGQMAKILEVEKETKAAKLEYKHQVAELRLARGKESALNKGLREWQAQDFRLKRKVPNAAVKCERTMGFISKKASQVGDLKERFERTKFDIEKKDVELERLYQIINSTIKSVLKFGQDLTSYPKDPVAQLDVIARTMSRKVCAMHQNAAGYTRYEHRKEVLQCEEVSTVEGGSEGELNQQTTLALCSLSPDSCALAQCLFGRQHLFLSNVKKKC